MEQLIKQLNDTTNRPSPGEVRRIERDIQAYQRDFAGWRLGVDLLANGEPLMRFYGALTLTIKINADWDKDNLAQDDSLRTELLQQLVRQYAVLTNAHDTAFVLRKLCSTLVAYLLQPTAQWLFPFRHVLASIFEHGSALQLQQLSQHGVAEAKSLAPSMNTMTYCQLRGILWFGLSLVEDGFRNDLKGAEGTKLTNRIADNGADVWQLLVLALQSFHIRMGTPNTPDLVKLRNGDIITTDIALSIQGDQLVKVIKEEVLPTALAWMKFVPRDTYENDNATSLYISRSLALIVQSFSFPLMADPVIEILTELAQSAPRYFQILGTNAIQNILVSSQADAWLLDLREGDFSPESMRFSEFLLSLVELEDLSSPDYFSRGDMNRIISVLQLLLQCKGTAVVEDMVCQIALEAFSQIAEGFLDWIGTSVSDEPMKDLITNVCTSCVLKTQYPLEEMDTSTQVWDASDRTKFRDFRHDVEDFFLSAFSALGSALLEHIARTATTTDTWESFEAGLFCLGTLSDTMSNDTDTYDSCVSWIFKTAKWNAIVQNSETVPSRARQSAINYISRNTSFLQRHPEQLLPSLSFLFSSLQYRTSTSPASRAIQTLCDTQRASLVVALPEFVAALNNLSHLPSDDKHRLYSAVASVIQALPDEERKLQPLTAMLKLLFSDLETLSQLVDKGSEDALPQALDIVQSLAAIGKGLRAPAETAIDLDSTQHPQSQYWISGPGKHVQVMAQEIASQTTNFADFRFDGAIIEALCDFMKAGYTEVDPCPFKFSTDASADFFASRIELSTPSISTVMAAASSFLASTDLSSPAFSTVIAAVIDVQRKLLSTFATTKQYEDHDFTYSSLDFLVRLLPKWGGRLCTMPNSDQILQVLLEFALLGLENPDTLPRRSSATFWAALFDISGYPSVLSKEASSNLLPAVQAHAARFTAVLLRLLSGECARSELEALTEPLKRFVAKQAALAKRLLREAVREDAGVLSQRALAAVSEEARGRFVAQVEGLRGGRKTNEVVREFWVACRGSAFGYVA